MMRTALGSPGAETLCRAEVASPQDFGCVPSLDMLWSLKGEGEPAPRHLPHPYDALGLSLPFLLVGPSCQP